MATLPALASSQEDLQQQFYATAALDCQQLNDGMSVVKILRQDAEIVKSAPDPKAASQFLGAAFEYAVTEVCPQYKQDLLNVIDPANNGTDDPEIIELQKELRQIEAQFNLPGTTDI